LVKQIKEINKINSIESKIKLKTPISYYGGKQRMTGILKKYIPEHVLYAEVFFGGGAFFFEKEPSKVEVINDLDGRVINFYRVLKSEFELLKYMIDQTPHSRKVYQDAGKVLEYPDLFTTVKRAWAFWVRCNMGFASAMDAGFGYDKLRGTCEKKIDNKRKNFTVELSKRLDRVQIECTDAVRIIKSRDTENSFFYCDPPYFNANMGHYGGYTIDDFIQLLDTLSKIKGKFLLSSYPSEILSEYTKKFGWKTKEFNMPIAVTNKTSSRKIEVLTANYPLK